MTDHQQTTPPDQTLPSLPADGRRAGATWVAATGAFLLVAAAAVFVAVRWDTLTEAARIGVVAALTAAFLLGGRGVRRTLPSTGDVLFHLGAFLLPIDLAGLGLRLSVGWRPLVLAEGVLGVAGLGALAAGTGSVVLAWTAASSAAVLCLGVAALTPVPAPLVLAIAAVGAAALRRHRLASYWAAIAGLAPVAAQATATTLTLASGRDLGLGTLADLGLAGASAGLLAGLSGLLSAGVLAREAGRRRDLAQAALAVVSLLSGMATAVVAARPDVEQIMIGLPAAFLVIEAVALVATRDHFWRRPAAGLALGAEALAAVATPLAAVLVLAAPIVEDGLGFFSDAPPWQPQPGAALAWSLAAIGWVVAGWRRTTPGRDLFEAAVVAATGNRTVVFVASCAAAALVVGSADTGIIAVGLLVLAAGLVAGGSGLATTGAVALAGWAPIVLSAHHEVGVQPAAGAGAALLTVGALRWRTRPRQPPRHRTHPGCRRHGGRGRHPRLGSVWPDRRTALRRLRVLGGGGGG